MDTLNEGPETRTLIPSVSDARRELESSRHVKEPHVVELPPCDTEDMQSHVPIAQVGEHHSASRPLTDVLPQNATDALDEAANRRHAHVDRAKKGASPFSGNEFGVTHRPVAGVNADSN